LKAVFLQRLVRFSVLLVCDFLSIMLRIVNDHFIRCIIILLFPRKTVCEKKNYYRVATSCFKKIDEILGEFYCYDDICLQNLSSKRKIFFSCTLINQFFSFIGETQQTKNYTIKPYSLGRECQHEI